MRRIVACFIAAVVLGSASASVAAQNQCEEITFENFNSCDISEALKRTFDEASRGDEIALYTLGRLYEEGGQSSETSVITRDLEKAAHYYELAAEKGYMSAQARVAWLYNKYFLPYKQKERDYWACKAVIRGSHQATVNLNNEIAVTKSHETWEAFCADVLPNDEQPSLWQKETEDSKRDDCLNKKPEEIGGRPRF